jgi:YebC/PmpR family DNA-binding regulatory protein
MSGHSKWSQIKRQKGVTDAKKGAAFTKLGNTITVVVREGGKDPAMNFRLRLAIDKARAANMPKDNIDRAIKRGAGEMEGQKIEQVTYEGYGPGGAAIVVDALTDNRNRTSSELRAVFSKHGGSLAGTNSVLWMFQPRGYFEVPAADKRDVKSRGDHVALRETIELVAIDAGAEDIREDDDSLLIFTDPAKFQAVRQALETTGAAIQVAETRLVPSTTLAPKSATEETAIQNLLLALEELDDVTGVATNADV